MIDYKEVVDLYRDLDLNDKRNEFNILLQKVDALIIELLKRQNQKNEASVNNYNITSDKDKTEDEIMTCFYEDLLHIKNKLLLLMTIEMANSNKE